jgi:hypothetical protein
MLRTSASRKRMREVAETVVAHGNLLRTYTRECRQAFSQTLVMQAGLPLTNMHTHTYTHTISLSLSLSLSHTHTHTHTHAFSLTHTRSFPLSVSLSHARTHTQILNTHQEYFVKSIVTINSCMQDVDRREGLRMLNSGTRAI